MIVWGGSYRSQRRDHTLEGRLLRRVRITEGNCWEWTGCVTDRGYGQIAVGGRKARGVHRVAYELWIGPIPDGLHVDHLCRNRICLNPKHLEAVTAAENNRRAIPYRKVVASQTHCKRGHEFTPENTRRSPQGWRICRTCVRERTRRRRSAA